jgi:plastocyanin
MRIPLLCLALLGASSLVGAVTSAGRSDTGRAPGVTHTVKIDGTGFDPETLEVKVGDTVVWVNHDPFPHTATSRVAGVFDSKEIAAGKSWRFKVTRKGEFAYTCAIHPTMKGTLQAR